eukprot:gene6207-10213_t
MSHSQQGNIDSLKSSESNSTQTHFSKKLFGCGNNNSGTLGIQTTESTSKLTEINFFHDKKIKSVSCGEFSTIVSCESKIYGAGDNSYGQLGLQSYSDHSKFTEIKSLSSFEILEITMGGYHTIIRNTDGKLYGFGSNKYGQLGFEDEKYNQPKELKFFEDKEVLKVYCGYNFSIVECKDGFYAFGSNGYGQLGIGTNFSPKNPQKIKYFEGKNITKMSCGYTHCLALENDSTVYSWGSNVYGEIGTGNDDITTPTVIFDQKGVSNIIASYYFSIVITGGSLYACGWNELEQLGLSDTKNRYKLEKINSISDVKLISSFGHHTVAVKENGEVFGWGKNDSGQLGAWESTSHSVIPIDINQKVIVDIFCSNRSTFLLEGP